MFRDHGVITAMADGAVCSAAVMIYLGATRRLERETSMIMLHSPTRVDGAVLDQDKRYPEQWHVITNLLFQAFPAGNEAFPIAAKNKELGAEGKRILEQSLADKNERLHQEAVFLEQACRQFGVNPIAVNNDAKRKSLIDQYRNILQAS